MREHTTEPRERQIRLVPPPSKVEVQRAERLIEWTARVIAVALLAGFGWWLVSVLS